MSSKLPVVAVFDVGKTNKKFLLFDEEYNVVFEESVQLNETMDEDGYPCEDVFALTSWLQETFARRLNDPGFEIRAINFSAYGASFVYLDDMRRLLPPLYNYLKPYPPQLQKKFYHDYDGEGEFSRLTASPALGNLNSGMQLYRLKYEKPEKFAGITYALHLPQYLSFVLTSSLHSEITSIGCHTNLWNFRESKYHRWVKQEGIDKKLPAIVSSRSVVGYVQGKIPAGAGLHDSSSALIPYLSCFSDPFVLLSTGTWSISLNAFSNEMLSDNELAQDCLCYLSYEGKPVKASRLFAGYEHEQQARRLAEFFSKPVDYYTSISFDKELFNVRGFDSSVPRDVRGGSKQSRMGLADSDLAGFKNYEQAYHYVMADIVARQVWSTSLVLKGTDKRLFVDGGFSQNPIFMRLLSESFPNIEVYAASVPQASALGAALVIHQCWNPRPVPANLVAMRI